MLILFVWVYLNRETAGPIGSTGRFSFFGVELRGLPIKIHTHNGEPHGAEGVSF